MTDGVVYGDDTNPMTYSYNLSGALIEQKYPSGRVVRNTLDTNGDLMAVLGRKPSRPQFWAYANGFKYNAAGAVTSLQLGNGNWESTQFNSRLQPTQIALRRSFVGTKGRSPALQPADSTVFFVIALNENAVFTQTVVSFGNVSAAPKESTVGDGLLLVLASGNEQKAGVGQQVRPGSYFIHEESEIRNLQDRESPGKSSITVVLTMLLLFERPNSGVR